MIICVPIILQIVAVVVILIAILANSSAPNNLSRPREAPRAMTLDQAAAGLSMHGFPSNNNNDSNNDNHDNDSNNNNNTDNNNYYYY